MQGNYRRSIKREGIGQFDNRSYEQFFSTMNTVTESLLTTDERAVFQLFELLQTGVKGERDMQECWFLKCAEMRNRMEMR